MTNPINRNDFFAIKMRIDSFSEELSTISNEEKNPLSKTEKIELAANSLKKFLSAYKVTTSQKTYFMLIPDDEIYSFSDSASKAKDLFQSLHQGGNLKSEGFFSLVGQEELIRLNDLQNKRRILGIFREPIPAWTNPEVRENLNVALLYSKNNGLLLNDKDFSFRCMQNLAIFQTYFLVSNLNYFPHFLKKDQILHLSGFVNDCFDLEDFVYFFFKYTNKEELFQFKEYILDRQKKTNQELLESDGLCFGQTIVRMSQRAPGINLKTMRLSRFIQAVYGFEFLDLGGKISTIGKKILDNAEEFQFFLSKIRRRIGFNDIEDVKTKSGLSASFFYVFIGRATLNLMNTFSKENRSKKTEINASLERLNNEIEQLNKEIQSTLKNPKKLNFLLLKKCSLIKLIDTENMKKKTLTNEQFVISRSFEELCSMNENEEETYIPKIILKKLNLREIKSDYKQKPLRELRRYIQSLEDKTGKFNLGLCGHDQAHSIFVSLEDSFYFDTNNVDLITKIPKIRRFLKLDDLITALERELALNYSLTGYSTFKFVRYDRIRDDLWMDFYQG